MRLVQDVKFDPIAIILESREELLTFATMMDDGAFNSEAEANLARKISDVITNKAVY